MTRTTHLGAVSTLALAAALSLATPADAGNEKAISNVVPVRFIQTLDCQPGSGCEDNIPAAMLQDSIRRANEVLDDAGIKLWMKSNERYYLPKFHTKNEDSYSWSQVKYGLRQVFPQMPLDAYDNTLDVKTAILWQGATAALYGDPDELLVWIMDEGGIGQSSASFPHSGRAAYLVADNLWKDFGAPTGEMASTHLAHELGHFFGMRHPWEANNMTNPATGLPWTYADQWDQLYCESSAGGLTFYASAQAYLDHGCTSGTLRRIARDNDYIGTGGDPFGPVYVEIGSHVLWAGEDSMKGISIWSGDEHNPPQSFAWAINVMTYYGTWGVDLRAPAFIPASLVLMVRAYMTYNLDFNQAARDAFMRYDGTLPHGATEAGLTSQRPSLGTGVEDFIWWANGDFSFARQTKPIAGTDFEPISGDFDADGFDDILWYRSSTGKGNLWWSDGDRTFTAQNQISFVTGARPFSGDFDGNGADDIYMYRPGSASDYIWWGDGDGTFTATVKNVDGHYLPVVGNFDNAHGDDIAWYYAAGGYANFWWSDGDKTFTGQNSVPVEDGEAYTPIVGNFDGEHGDDIFWYRPGPGQDRIWFSVGAQFFVEDNVPNVKGTYLPLPGDFNGDGRDDIFWDAVNHTTDYIWAGTGDQLEPFDTSRSSAVYGSFKPVVGTFDDDASSDVFWYRAQ